ISNGTSNGFPVQINTWNTSESTPESDLNVKDEWEYLKGRITVVLDMVYQQVVQGKDEDSGARVVQWTSVGKSAVRLHGFACSLHLTVWSPTAANYGHNPSADGAHPASSEHFK
ncbi:hypothetical protein CSKR_113519, partial [Clonorchis sinensis]